jgi:hypothetical protein
MRGKETNVSVPIHIEEDLDVMGWVGGHSAKLFIITHSIHNDFLSVRCHPVA